MTVFAHKRSTGFCLFYSYRFRFIADRDVFRFFKVQNFPSCLHEYSYQGRQRNTIQQHKEISAKGSSKHLESLGKSGSALNLPLTCHGTPWKNSLYHMSYTPASGDHTGFPTKCMSGVPLQSTYEIKQHISRCVSESRTHRVFSQESEIKNTFSD